MPLTFADDASAAIPLHIIESAGLDAWLEGQADSVVDWVRLNGFKGRIGQTLLVPAPEGG